MAQHRVGGPSFLSFVSFLGEAETYVLFLSLSFLRAEAQDLFCSAPTGSQILDFLEIQRDSSEKTQGATLDRR